MRETEHPLYLTWRGITLRCNPKYKDKYPRYAGRGITICSRWSQRGGFWNFIADMGDKPSPRHSIDRIDNDGNYEPSNCRWATYNQQALNRVTNSQHPGVIYSKQYRMWLAYLETNKEKVLYKRFNTLQEAIEARKQAEVTHGIN